MLYKTSVEYGDYTMNHVFGCAHGCKYPCYAFLMAKRFGKVASYEDWIKPQLVGNTLDILNGEIPRLKPKIKSVQLCFSTDPFMYGYDEVTNMSLSAIEKLNTSDIKCTVLTKGLLPIELASMSKENEYGITLISLDEKYREKVEPGAVSYEIRLAALRALHNKGFKTWLSIEPYPTPNLITQDLGVILKTAAFADKIIFGRTNYCKNVSEYKNHRHFYDDQANKVIRFCVNNNIQYHIKNGTLTESTNKKQHHSKNSCHAKHVKETGHYLLSQ
jgi:DNA repair photolyase